MTTESYIFYCLELTITFPPTYKYAIGSNEFDGGEKNRCPAWTDRILFVPRGLTCMEYTSMMDLQSSDHKPVFASFVCTLGDFPAGSPLRQSQGVERRVGVGGGETLQFTSESQVCTLS